MAEEDNNIKRMGAGIVAALTTVAIVTPLTSKLLNQELLVSFPTKISGERLYEPRVGNLLEEGLHISPVGNLLEEGLHISPVGNLLVQRAVPIVKPPKGLTILPFFLPIAKSLEKPLAEAGKKVGELLESAGRSVRELFGDRTNPPLVTCFNNRSGRELDNSSVDNSSNGETNTPCTEEQQKFIPIIQANVEEQLRTEFKIEDKRQESKIPSFKNPEEQMLVIGQPKEGYSRREIINESERLAKRENKKNGNILSPAQVSIVAASAASAVCAVLGLDSKRAG